MRFTILVPALVVGALGCKKQEEKKAPPPRPAVAPKESFEERYGGIWVDVVSRAIQTRDGGFLLVGDSEKVDDRYKGDYDGYVVRADAAGERVWSWKEG